MTCPHCDKAMQGPCYATNPACEGCRARAIAQGPAFFESGRSGKITKAYRAQLAAAGVTHAQVKEWAYIIGALPRVAKGTSE